MTCSKGMPVGYFTSSRPSNRESALLESPLFDHLGRVGEHLFEFVDAVIEEAVNVRPDRIVFPQRSERDIHSRLIRSQVRRE
jgi:hypothetical protein